MADSPIRISDEKHPITIEAGRAHVRVLVDGAVIADTRSALVLREANYPPVYYVPRRDVAMDRLVPSDHSSHCPYKGDAGYFSIMGKRGERRDAVWTYPDPHPAVAEIAGYLAFYPDRVDAIEVD